MPRQTKQERRSIFVTTPFIDDYKNSLAVMGEPTSYTFDEFAKFMIEQAERHTLSDVIAAAGSPFFMDRRLHLHMDFLPVAIGEWGDDKYIVIRGEVVRFDWDDKLNVT